MVFVPDIFFAKNRITEVLGTINISIFFNFVSDRHEDDSLLLFLQFLQMLHGKIVYMRRLFIK